jgi:hypothetical protein
MTTKPPLPLTVRSDFREQARRIVRADMEARLAGWSQNTIGSIQRALEAAFRHGRTFHQTGPIIEPLRWEDLPPRAREALGHIGLSDHVRKSGDTRLVRGADPNGRVRWYEQWDRDRGYSYTDGAIKPLLQHGLLARVGDDATDNETALTSAGRTLFADYWQRREKNDGTLPLEGMRPSSGYR